MKGFVSQHSFDNGKSRGKNKLLFMAVKQRVSLFISFTQQDVGKQIDCANAQDAEPDAAHRKGIRHLSDHLLSRQLESAGEDGVKGGESAAMGGGNSSGKVRLLTDGLHNFTQRKDNHRHKVKDRQILRPDKERKADENQQLTNQKTADILQGANPLGQKRGSDDDNQRIDAG